MYLTEKTEVFLKVIQTHKGILYKITNAYCKDPEDRDDLTQEIIFHLWKSFDSYNQEYKYSTWMYRIALNVAISFHRKEKGRKNTVDFVGKEAFLFVEQEKPEEKEASLTLLEQAISELKDLDKALILLYLEEKSYKEIAEIIGITETNVATKLSRIKNVIKQKLSLKLWKTEN